MSPVEVAWPATPNRIADWASPGTALVIVLAVSVSSAFLEIQRAQDRSLVELGLDVERDDVEVALRREDDALQDP
jgi:hypothetical protein